MTTTLPAQLALRFKCNIIPIYLTRNENKFEMEILSPIIITDFNVSKNDEEKFNCCLSTVNKQLTIDKNKLGKGAFLEKYGHLRPGTYDILSARYDEAPELYFDWTPDNQIQIANEFSLSDKQVSLLDQEHPHLP